MMRQRHKLLAGAAVFFLAACSSAPTGTSAQGDRRLLTAAQISATGYEDAYKVVENLRPNWLKQGDAMSLGSLGEVRVYLDGDQLGGPDRLRDIPAKTIEEMRWLSVMEATTRGLNRNAAVIMVTSRKPTP